MQTTAISNVVTVKLLMRQNTTYHVSTHRYYDDDYYYYHFVYSMICNNMICDESEAAFNTLL